MNNPNLADFWTTSDGYAKRFQPEEQVEQNLELLMLESAKVLVDVGCGNGAFSIAAAQRFPHIHVKAFDALQSAVDECNSRAAALHLSQVRAAVAWGHDLPINDSITDRALSRFVLHHVSNPDEFFSEVHRILAPGGRFVLQTPCNAWDGEMAAVLREMFLRMDTTHPRCYYQPGEISEMLEAAGFKAGEAETEKFDFPYLSREMAQVVERRGVADLFELRQIDDSTWSVELYWTRIVAVK